MSKYVPIHLIPYFIHIGYNLECGGYYDSEKKLIDPHSTELSYLYKELGYPPKFTINNVPAGSLPSILKSDLKDWLRDTKNIHFYVYPKVVSPKKTTTYRYTFQSEDITFNNLTDYETYNDAFEKALEYIASLDLKNLEKGKGLFI